jgi:hypothetical protein
MMIVCRESLTSVNVANGSEMCSLRYRETRETAWWGDARERASVREREGA